MTSIVSLEQVLAFGLAAMIVIVIPGPSVIFVIGRAMTYGRNVALAGVLGNALGVLAVSTLVALGLGALVAESITIFNIIKFAGAIYLVWLGIQALRHRKDFSFDSRIPTQISGKRAISHGFIVGGSNPKVFILFAALLPQFVDRTHGHVQVQMFLLGFVAFAICLCTDSIWAITASQMRQWLGGSPRRGQTLATVGGVSMIGLGIRIATTRRAD